MKIKILYILCFMVSGAWSQVGIGTTTPQAELHVAGSTSTVRIESLNSTNEPLLNDGVKIAPAFVDGNGDITIAPSGFGTGGDEPLNFLIDVPNFIIDDQYFDDDAPFALILGTGTVVNSPVGSSTNEGVLSIVPLSVPQDATVEVKYGITMLVTGADITLNDWFYVTYDYAVNFQTYFCVDINGDGLSPAEKAIRYGYKGQSYETNYGGAIGYPYMNSQGYLTLPAGNHDIHFFGVVNDNTANFTGVGFGGDKDYLKIRVYN